MTLEIQLIFLIIVANGAPIIARIFCNHQYDYPLDGNSRFYDGQPIFGKSKTIRGIVASMLLTPVITLVIGLSWKIGLIIATFAMLGDLFSSFIKRRFHRPVSSQVLGIDQIPESLFPLLACKTQFEISMESILLIVTIFLIAELLLSRILYKLRIRRHPY